MNVFVIDGLKKLGFIESKKYKGRPQCSKCILHNKIGIKRKDRCLIGKAYDCDTTFIHEHIKSYDEIKTYLRVLDAHG